MDFRRLRHYRSDSLSTRVAVLFAHKGKTRWMLFAFVRWRRRCRVITYKNPGWSLNGKAARDPDSKATGLPIRSLPRRMPKDSGGTPSHHKTRVHVLSVTYTRRKDVAQSVSARPPTPQE